MRKLYISLLLALGLSLSSSLIAGEKPDVVGVLFYADWCGSCKVLDPKIEAVKSEFADEAILFTRVDMTDEFTKKQSAFLASLLDLDAVYEKNAPKTGFMLLVDKESGKVLGKLTKKLSKEEIAAAIHKSLAG